MLNEFAHDCILLLQESQRVTVCPDSLILAQPIVPFQPFSDAVMAGGVPREEVNSEQGPVTSLKDSRGHKILCPNGIKAFLLITVHWPLTAT
jgi:hypothetical protein